MLHLLPDGATVEAPRSGWQQIGPVICCYTMIGAQQWKHPVRDGNLLARASKTTFLTGTTEEAPRSGWQQALDPTAVRCNDGPQAGATRSGWQPPNTTTSHRSA